MLIGDYLAIEDGTVACATCDETLGSTDEHFKENLAVSEGPIANAGPHYIDPSRFVSEEMVFREFYCPRCGALLFTETARKGEPVLEEFNVIPNGEQ